MLATKSWAGAFASALFLVSTAAAQYSPVTGQYHAPVSKAPLGYAPDACGPGYYSSCPCGQVFGPNYCLRPCFEPYNGVRPTVYRVPGGGFQVSPTPPSQQQQQQQEARFPYHPWARGPRDFFMFRENLEEQLGRQTRPSVLP
jgi:hypothetical protein